MNNRHLRRLARAAAICLKHFRGDAPAPSNAPAYDEAQALRDAGATIGRDVFFGPGVYIESGFAHFLTAEDGVVLGPQVTVILHDSAFSNVLGLPVRFAPVVLKRNSYIGAGSLVLPGVTIGEHALVGAGSLVTHDIPARSVAYGRPARVVCTIDEAAARFKARQAGSDGMYLDFGDWRSLPEPRNDHVYHLYIEAVKSYLAQSRAVTAAEDRQTRAGSPSEGGFPGPSTGQVDP